MGTGAPSEAVDFQNPLLFCTMVLYSANGRNITPEDIVIQIEEVGILDLIALTSISSWVQPIPARKN